MNKMLKTSFLSLILLFVVAGALAQPSPPHEVYGTISDNGENAQGITVEAVTGSDVIVSDESSSDGYYELKVPSNYSSFDLVVDGSTEETGINVNSGSIEEYSFSGDYIPSGGTSLSVDVEDVSVDEGDTVDLDSSVSNVGDNPIYSWSIAGDSYGSSIVNSDSLEASFEAGMVSFNREIDIELTVTKDDGDGNSETSSGTVTVLGEDDDSEGGIDSPDKGEQEDNQQEQEEDNQEDNQQEQEEGEQDQDQQDGQEDQGLVEADVDEESGEASAEFEAGEGESNTVSIPEPVESDGSRVEGIEFTSSSDQNVSVSVREVDGQEAESEGVELNDDQVDVQEINVEGEVEDATLTFTVSKDVLEERNADTEDVVKQRFDSEAGWEDLETRHTEELEDRHRFEAGLPRFSYFATSIQTEDDGGLPWVPITVIVIVGLLAVAGFTQRKALKRKVEEFRE